MLKPARSYEEACRTFRWRIPERYNVAFDVCDRQTMAGADGHRTALVVEAEDGSVERYTFHVLRLLSNRLANVLAAKGVKAGDRVVVSFGPSVEAAVALLAVTKMGAVAVAVPATLGSEPLAWRLADSGAAAAVVAEGRMSRNGETLRSADLACVLAVGDAAEGSDEMWAAMERASDSFAPAVTACDDPAFLFYPADAAGAPSGVMHAHRALPGNLPTVEFALGFFPQFGDVVWGPEEWMGFEGLMWSVLPAWHHGVPVVVRQGRCDPDQALGVMARHGVRIAVLAGQPLTRLAEASARLPHPMLRALASGPVPLGRNLHEAVPRAFGVSVNEIWGTPETGGVAANNGEVMEIRPGSPGRAAPGVTVEAVDESGHLLRAGERGMLAVAPGAPGAFLGYHGETPPGRLRLPSGWLMTGRLGSRDLDGYLWPEPLALAAGMVEVGGLRVSLDDVQAALSRHPKVQAAGVVEVRGDIKACIVPRDRGTAGIELARELQDWIADRRAPHEVPRRVEFVDSVPLASDGRVDRMDLLNRPLTLDAPSDEDRF